MTIKEEKEVDVLLNFIGLNVNYNYIIEKKVFIQCVQTFVQLYPNYPSMPDNAH